MAAIGNQQMMVDLKVIDKLESTIAKSTGYSTERIRGQLVESQMIELVQISLTMMLRPIKNL